MWHPYPSSKPPCSGQYYANLDGETTLMYYKGDCCLIAQWFMPREDGSAPKSGFVHNDWILHFWLPEGT